MYWVSMYGGEETAGGEGFLGGKLGRKAFASVLLTQI